MAQPAVDYLEKALGVVAQCIAELRHIQADASYDPELVRYLQDAIDAHEDTIRDFQFLRRQQLTDDERRAV